MRRVAMLLLLALSVSAAEVRLGPEVPLLNDAAVGPAPCDQAGPFDPAAPRPAQRAAKLAYSSSRGILAAAWRNETNHVVQAVINGKPVLVAGDPARRVSMPAIAIGRENVLVAWFDGPPRNPAPSVEGKLLARRIAFDGTVLDVEPIRIGLFVSFDITRLDDPPPSIAYEQGAYFLAAPQPYSIDTIRITDDGKQVDPRQFFTVKFPRAKVRALASGAGAFVLPHLQEAHPDLIRDPGRTAPLTVTVGRTGVFGTPAILPPPAFSLWHSKPPDKSSFAAVYRDGRVTVAASLEGDGVMIGQTNAEGAAVRAMSWVRGTIGADVTGVDLAWNGSQYVVVWSEQPGVIRALHFDEEIQPLDAQPIDVARCASDGHVALAVTDDGVRLAYSRADLGTNTVRAFTRTIERLPGPPRRRAARH